MNEAIDYSTVKWVKQELDATLKQARLALEAYVENPSDESQLRFCSVHLHQVYGTLHMVELYGAALLAEEMEQVVEALLSGSVGQKQDAYELVMRGVLQLPDYLERLIAGGRDIPLILLPLLNDLRAIRGQKLLSENALFSPDLSCKLPAEARLEYTGGSLPSAARKCRHNYQLALLGWFRNKEVAANLQRMGDVLRDIQSTCAQDAAQCLWWIARGMVVALRENWLDTSMSTRLLLGQVDRQIKRAINEGEEGLLANPAQDLFKNLLFYVARAKDGGEPVSLIKQTYKLSSLMPTGEEMESAQGSLTGHNAELMHTVSIAVKEDLTQVKDALDIFLRGGSKAVADLQPAVETLNRIADTLGMLGLGALRKVAQAQAQSTADIVAGRCVAEEAVLMNIASALLYIESSLEGMGQGGAAAEEGAEADATTVAMNMPDAEFNQVRGVVADEALRDIRQAKDSILALMENSEDFSVLEGVPQLFYQIKGGMLLLNEQRTADLVETVRDFISSRMLTERLLPADASLNDLADVISSIEYYLENLREGRVFGQTILDVAEKSLARLNQDPMQAVEEHVTADEVDISSDEYLAEGLSVEDTDFALPEAEALATDEYTFSALALSGLEVDDQDSMSVSQDILGDGDDAFADITFSEDVSLAELSPFNELSEDAFAVDDATSSVGSAPVVTPPQTVDQPAFSVMADNIDEEILEIFIEESDEEFANISDCLPRWLDDEQNKEDLITMRRSFHTLKGSGRLVGALRIGEFAWGYESLLNRVLDGVLPRDEACCQIMGRALPALQELIEQIRTGAATTQPIEALMYMALALSRGESVNLADLDAPQTVAAVDMSAADVEEFTVSDTDTAELDNSGGVDLEYAFSMDAGVDAPAVDAGIDPVLYEIFCAETQDHIVTIRNFLECCRKQGVECRVTDDLMRALHTLHGSARMAGAEPIAEIGYEIEKYAKALRNDALPMSGDGLEITGQATCMIESLLVEMAMPDGMQTSNADLVAAISALPRTTQDVAHIPSADVPNDVDDIDSFMDEAAENEFIAESVSGIEGLAEVGDLDEVDAFSEEIDAFADADHVEVELTELAAVAEDVELTDFAVTGDSDPYDDFEAESLDSQATVEPAEAPVIAPAAQYVAAAVADTGEWINFDYQNADADLLEVFLEEGDEILGSIDAALQQWITTPDENSLMAELQRHLHTLKGGARMANLSAIGDLSHSLESLLIAVVEGQVPPNQMLFDLLFVAQDRLSHMLEATRAQKPMRAATSLIGQLEALRQGQPDLAIVIAEAPQQESVEVAEPIANVPTVESDAAAFSEDMQKFAGRGQQELVRVRADLLDNMVNFAGEINIYRSRLEQQVGGMRFNLSELGQTVTRLRDQLRQVEIETEAQVLFRYESEISNQDEHFDPLEMDRYSHLQQLSRSMLESIGDLVSIQGLLDNITRESETLLLQQARVNTELQEGLMRTRMVPFSGLAPRMRRILRQACQELGKRAELSLEGAEGEMDRTVIDRIIAPIEHMLRNALAHGIETPDQRRAAGKREAGSIKVSLLRDGSEVVIMLADDGAGINLEAIRRKAKERGMLVEGTDISDNDVMQFILETGFSTAEQVSQISGRGVGMDVVNSEVKQLGGSLHIHSRYGQGTTFTIRLPFTLAISQALLVQVHEEIYAIPLTSVEGIVRMHQDELSRFYDDASARFEYAGQNYPVQNLGVMLGQGAAVLEGGPKRLPVLLVRSGDHRMALQVESLLGSRETVVKSVGPQISTVRGISGATILGDGRVVLILDLGGLLRTGGLSMFTDRITPVIEVEQERVPLVMVVDDSITVRKVTTRLLERNDMQVITAKDGVDAVAKLQEHLPDVMLLDIEMPRMDGFELATHIRNEARLRGIPIIMITSRTGDKHRKRAMEIGVNRYLGKPFQEHELMGTIRELLAEKQVNA